jgi:hypothetical protein
MSSAIYRRAVRYKSTAVSHEHSTSIVRIAGFLLGLQFHPEDGDDIFKHIHGAVSQKMQFSVS